MKTCSNCKELQPFSNFYRNGKNFQSWCKSCKKESGRKWSRDNYKMRYEGVVRFYQNNPEKYGEYRRKRRARLTQALGSHTANDVKSLLKKQSNKCFYCSEPLESYHVDHMIPLSRGGSNSVENLCCACPKCNLEKHTLTAEEFTSRIRNDRPLVAASAT